MKKYLSLGSAMLFGLATATNESLSFVDKKNSVKAAQTEATLYS